MSAIAHDQTSWLGASLAWLAVVARLRDVKRRHDPPNVFRTNFPVQSREARVHEPLR